MLQKKIESICSDILIINMRQPQHDIIIVKYRIWVQPEFKEKFNDFIKAGAVKIWQQDGFGKAVLFKTIQVFIYIIEML